MKKKEVELLVIWMNTSQFRENIMLGELGSHGLTSSHLCRSIQTATSLWPTLEPATV